MVKTEIVFVKMWFLNDNLERKKKSAPDIEHKMSTSWTVE